MAESGGAEAVNEPYKATREQAILMVCASGFSNIVFTFTWVTKITGKPFWIAVFIGVLANIPLGIWIFHLGRHFQGSTVFDILEKGLGRFICGVIAVIYIILNITIEICMLNLFTGAVKLYFLERTPIWVIMLIILLICTLFANSGMQTFGKLIELLIVLCVVNYFAGFSVSFVKEIKLEYIMPVFDISWPGFAEGVLFTAGSVADGMLFLMVMAGSVPDPHKHYMWVVKGFTYWAFVLSLAILLMAGAVSTEVLSRIGQAGIAVARVFQVREFIRGMEVFMLMSYQYIAIIRTIMILYSCWISSQKLIHIKKPWVLLVLISIAIFLGAVWVNSYNTGFFLAVFLGYYIVLPFVILILLLASLSAAIKKRKTGSEVK